MDYKTEIFNSLKSEPFIRLPDFEDYYADPDVSHYKPKQHEMLLRFDSVSRVDKPDSIVDFIIKKGGSSLYVGLMDNGFNPSSDQRSAIQKHGMPYLWIDLRYASLVKSWSEALQTGLVEIIPNSEEVAEVIRRFNATCNIQLINWYYHSKHGIHYGRPEK